MFRLLIIFSGVIALFLLTTGVLSLGIWARTERSFPAPGKFIEVGGAQLHYVEQGRGRPIVMIHGSMLNTRDMEMSLFPSLVSDYRVIAFDRPGLGHSTRAQGQDLEDPRNQARLIHAALGEMGIAQPVIVAHSWGGAVALAYAMEFPQDVKGLVLISSAAYPSNEQIGLYNLAQMPVVGSVARHTFLPPLMLAARPTLLDRFFGPNTPPPEYLDQVGLSLMTDPDRFLNDAMDFNAVGPALAQMRNGYRTMRTQMIIVTGDEDRAVSPEDNSYRLHNEVVGSEMIVLEGIGHMPHHMATDKVVEAIVTMVER